MRLLSIPAMVVGIAVAIIFFKIYGAFTRPDVPRPVAFVVSKFAPGVEIGAKVADAATVKLGATTYLIGGRRGRALATILEIKIARAAGSS